MTLALLAVSAVGFALIAMLMAYALVTRALNREIRAVRGGQYVQEIGYRRYIASSVTIVRAAALTAPLVPLVSVIALVTLGNDSAIMPLVQAADIERGIGNLVGYTLCLCGALFVLPFSAYDLLTVPLGIRALAELRGIRLAGREAFTFRLKRVLVRSAPGFVLVEAAGTTAFVNPVAALVVLVAGLVALIILRRAFATQLMLWMTPSVPIERTQWAALGPRIHEWGRLIGVRVKTIYVQRTERLGIGPIAAVGPRHARVVFTGDALLSNTDWRQQDALIVYVLTANASRIARRGRRFSMLISLGFLVVAVGMGGALTLTAQSGSEPPLAALIALLIASLVVLLGFLVVLGFSIYNLIFGRQRLRRRFIEADARAVAITGDPLGLLVALNTLSALSGTPTERRIGAFPSTSERVAALDALLRQPGPRAPYAWQLVPSTVPVYVGPYCLTVLLAAVQPSAPAPVPAGPYPTVMPLAAAPMHTPATVPMSSPAPVPFTPPIPPMDSL